MKRMKRFLAILLAAVMVMSIGSMSVMADDADTNEYCITVSGVDTANHTYQAYQVFSGFTSGGVISNITWGTGVDTTGDLITNLKALKVSGTTPFSDISEGSDNYASSVATVLSNYTSKDDEVVLAFADFISGYLTTDNSYIYTATAAESDGKYTYTFSDLPAGYYLVLDASTSNTNSAYTNYILVTAGNAETDPTVTDSYTSYNHVAVKASYPTVSKSADDYTAAIGDTVTFTLTGTVPDMTYYDTYYYAFTDTLSEGLTYVADSLKVYAYTDDTSVAGVEVTDMTGESDTDGGYTLDVIGQVITVSFSDLKTVVGTNKYTTIVVTYDATLNDKAVLGTTSTANTNTVYITYSNDPNWDGIGTEPTGTTVEEVVYVNTFELLITKYGSNASAGLSGAIFQLYYIDDSDVTWYAIVDQDETSSTYQHITGWTSNTPTLGGNTEITTDSNGAITVYGLDEGTYYLEELKAPSGYNLLSDPIVFTITATTAENGKLTALSASTTAVTSIALVTATGSTGMVSMNVYNTAGSTLPTTGGIGTTIFYIVGTILVFGAAVILVTRRRMTSR